MYVLNTVFQYQ